MRSSAFAAIAIAVASLSATEAAAQSFNCNYAKRADEMLICQQPNLSALDERMAALYSRLQNEGRGQRFSNHLRAEQDEWLAGRMSCGYDAGCVERSYTRRIRQLSAL